MKGDNCYGKDKKGITMCDSTYYYRGKSEKKATRLVDTKRASKKPMYTKL